MNAGIAERAREHLPGDVAMEQVAAELAPVAAEIERHRIETAGRFMREIAEDATVELVCAESKSGGPLIYLRGGSLVRLNDSGGVEPLGVDSLRGLLDRLADFVATRNIPDGGEVQRPARPPQDVVRTILALPDTRFYPLNSIAYAPVFLPDGRLLDRPGYDAEAGILLLHNLGTVGNVTLPEAVNLLVKELLGEFPFADGAETAHAISALVLPFVRNMIDGPTPLHLIEAPARGTGKGLIAEVISIVVTGAPAFPMSQPRDADEIEKRITAALIGAAPVILLDNLTRLDARPLMAALTSDTWRGRVLGQSRIVDVPNRALWLATGNNVSLSDEAVRRVVPIRLDAHIERPEERTGWKHPDLRKFALSHRVNLVGACISLVKAWLDAGRPTGKATLGRYENWAAVIGGILDVAGISGFLTGRDRLRTEADIESGEWAALCQLWGEAFGERPVGASDVLPLAVNAGILAGLWAGHGELARRQKFGRALQTRRDRIFAGYAIRLAGRDGTTHNLLYRVEGREKTPETTELQPGQSGVSVVSGVSNGPPQETEIPDDLPF